MLCRHGDAQSRTRPDARGTTPLATVRVTPGRRRSGIRPGHRVGASEGSAAVTDRARPVLLSGAGVSCRPLFFRVLPGDGRINAVSMIARRSGHLESLASEIR
ncbi:hypothetical protein GCM10009624_33460 [Gordonia sinesedis]